MRTIPIFAAAVILSACAAAPPRASVPPPPPPIGANSATASIGFGTRATLNGITIRPLALVEDSRCPTNTHCIWAGRLVIAVEIDQRGGSETLRTNMTLGQPLAVTAGTLTLVDAARPAHQFTFRLTR